MLLILLPLVRKVYEHLLCGIFCFYHENQVVCFVCIVEVISNKYAQSISQHSNKFKFLN